MERAFLFVNRLVCGVLLAVSRTLVFSNAVMRYGFGQSFTWRDEHPCRQPLPEPEALSLDGHVYSLHAYLMSDRFFNRLGKEEQAAVLQGTEIAKVIHRGMTAAQDANAETILKEKGVTVTRLTSAQIDAFRQRS